MGAQTRSTEGYPNIEHFGSFGEDCKACQPYTGAGRWWCGRKWKKKADQQANEILFHWGLVKKESGKKTGEYKCNFTQKNRRYDLKGLEISPEQMRALINCDSLESKRDEAKVEYANIIKERETNQGVGGKKAKGQKIDERKWMLVSQALQAATDSTNANYETCLEEEVIEDNTYVIEKGEKLLDDMPEPMTNTTLALLVAGGSAAMMFAIYKISK